MIILQADDVKISLPMDQTIEAMKTAFMALSSGNAEVPLRSHLEIKPFSGTSLFMPAFVQDPNGDSLTIKSVSIFPQNSDRKLPIIHAAVLVFEAETGRIEALIEGGSLTAIRTGAASGAATDVLALPESKRVAIFGAGVQGRTQLEAVCSVRNIITAWIYDPNREKSNALVNDLAGKGNIPEDLRIAVDPNNHLDQVEIICTATISKSPVYSANAIKPGTHINGVGSFTLEMIENPPEIITLDNTFVDSVEAAIVEAGEIVEALNQRNLKHEDLTEIGQVFLGNSIGRKSGEQITFFKSVGVAVQDALAANLALQNSRDMGLGVEVPW